MDRIDELESKSIYIIREAYKEFKNLGMLWSIGKDSTTLLWLCKKAFFGKVPFPVIYIDTGEHFQEMYDFRDRCVKKWNLELIVSQNIDKAKEMGIDHKDKIKCCNIRKTVALKNTIAQHKFDALFLGIRRDEHAMRNIERYFSPRDKEFRWKIFREKEKWEKGDSPFEALQPTEMWNLYQTDFGDECSHVRVHPILHWNEVDIWRYIKRENLPVNPLYFAKDGKRYRSLGCGFLILGPSISFSNFACFYLFDYFINIRGLGIDRICTGLTAKTSVAFAVLGKI